MSQPAGDDGASSYLDGTTDDVLLCTTVGCDVPSALRTTSSSAVYENPRYRRVVAVDGHLPVVVVDVGCGVFGDAGP